MPKLASRHRVRFWERTRPWNLLLSRRSTTAPSTSDLTTSSRSIPHLSISSRWHRASVPSVGVVALFPNTWLHNSVRKAAELASFSNTTPQHRAAPARDRDTIPLVKSTTLSTYYTTLAPIPRHFLIPHSHHSLIRGTNQKSEELRLYIA